MLAVVLLATACSSSSGGEQPAADAITPSAEAASPSEVVDLAPSIESVVENTVVVAARELAQGAKFDPDSPAVDVVFTPAEPINAPSELRSLVTYNVEPVGSDSNQPAHFFVPEKLLEERSSENVLAMMWDDETAQWIFLPTEAVDEGLLVWTPHFSVFGFVEALGDGLIWVGESTASGAQWLGDKTVGGIKAVISAVWSAGKKVADALVAGLASLDTLLGGVAKGPPTCPDGDAPPIGFELGRAVSNDDDKVLVCHWTDRSTERLTLRVTNNRPYGMSMVFDSSLAHAEILEWPNTDLVSADRLITRAFDHMQDTLGQFYLPSGATAEVVWDVIEIDEIDIRFEATLANAAIDPALAMLLALPKAAGIAIEGLSYFDCFTGFVSAVLELNQQDDILATVNSVQDAFTDGVACFGGAFGATVKEVLGAGVELIKVIRNSLSLLADSVVEGHIKVRILLRFERSAEPLVQLSTDGIGEYPFGSDFDGTLEFISSLLGPPVDVRRSQAGGCGAIGGCELLARWDSFSIAGPHEANIVAFWAVSTTDEMAAIFSLPGPTNLSDARAQSAWRSPIGSFVLSDDGTWVLSLAESGLKGLTTAPVPPGDWIDKGPPLPEDAPIVTVFANGNWQGEQSPERSTADFAACADVPIFSSPLEVSCQSGWAVSPSLLSYNSAWHLYRSIDSDWIEVDVGLTCCRPADIETTFDNLLKRNDVPSDVVVEFCIAAGIPLDDSGAGCAPLQEPISNPCGTRSAHFLGRTPSFAVSVCSGSGVSTYIGESLDTGATARLSACRLGSSPASDWVATSSDGYSYRIAQGRLRVLGPDGAAIVDEPFLEEHRDHRGSPVTC